MTTARVYGRTIRRDPAYDGFGARPGRTRKRCAKSGGKLKFKTRDKALGYADGLGRRDLADIRVYQCPLCRKWHMASYPETRLS